MNPTRRDVLKLASALGLAGALPPTAERVAAVQLLDREVSTHPLLDPAAFASEVDGLLGGSFDDDWLMTINPTEYVAYNRARDVVRREVTTLDGEDSMRILGDWEAAVFNYIMGAYSAGVRHGAAYEGLRRSVVGEVTTCGVCQGVGAKDEGTCRSCAGTGTVALRA